MPDDVKTFVSRLRVRDTTKANYTSVLRRFQRSAGDRGIDSTEAGIEFVSGARCPRTGNLYLSTINLYRRSRSLPALPDLRCVKPQRHQFNPPRIAEAFDKLLPLCRIERDRALLALLRYGGLRISEAITLRASDITFPHQQLQVSIAESKTTPRDPLVWRATKFLRDYLDRSAPSGWLFPTLHGHISKRTVEGWFIEWSSTIGFHVTPHDFRRLCATEMAAKFGIRPLMDYFGWSSVATAEIYISKARGSSTAEILSALGIGKSTDLFTTGTCWRCGATNPPNQVHCGTCGELADPTAIPQRERIDTLDEQGLEKLLVEILVKRGILPPRS
jgi:integrase